GLPAVWIEASLRDQAHVFGYTVVDASTVIATHLNHVMQSHSTELLGRLETQSLLDHLATESPKLVEDLVPKQISLGVLHRALQNLLEEGVNIRDVRTIIETLAEHAPRSQDPLELTSLVRIALGRAIVQQIYPVGSEMQVMALEPTLERLLGQALQGGSDSGGIEPGLAETLLRETADATRQQDDLGLPAVLLVPGHLRWLLSRFLRRAVPQLKVLANGEVPDSKIIKVTTIIGARK
ncbi:MAG: FHIPEP family type III secretion protein, partial [Polynucleobacter sp.]|nr:FHIPEP family type III secretion protein [Polynucleobacter sp.]